MLRLEFKTVTQHIEHVLMHCQKHDAKRRQLIKNLGDMKVKLDLVDLFCKKLKSESYQAFFFFKAD